ncbi:MAG: hypothetical protein IPL32_20000 [Chloracidobacterium sp.]|nr:hypothetical protein [Chloracidobacterium sp.]
MTKTAEILEKLVKGLNFLSETDDFWQVFLPTARRKGAVTSATMKDLTRLGFQEQLDFDTFMDHTIASQTVSQGQAVGKRYRELRTAFITHLGQRKVFKMINSPNNYEYYVVGISRNNNLTGVFVTSVET